MGLNVELLEKSFELVSPRGDEVVELFYKYLFEDYPNVKPLFSDTDIKRQQSKLLASLALVVSNLRLPEKLVPALEQLGQRHIAYGAEDAYYPAVGATLIKSLAKVAGDAWNDDLQNAWTDAYVEVATHMKAGAVVSAS